MNPTLLILDDWEGRIAASSCWKKISAQVQIRFLSSPIDTVSDADLSGVNFLMAIRERTALTEGVFARLPQLKLVLQTGGHAYHIDQGCAKKRGIIITMGRRAKAPLLSVPELTIAMNLYHPTPLYGHKTMSCLRRISVGQWKRSLKNLHRSHVTN